MNWLIQQQEAGFESSGKDAVTGGQAWVNYIRELRNAAYCCFQC